MRDQNRKIRSYRTRDFKVTDGKVIPTNVEKSNGNDKEDNINRLRNVLKGGQTEICMFCHLMMVSFMKFRLGDDSMKITLQREPLAFLILSKYL
jgi:hypothetical protein